MGELELCVAEVDTKRLCLPAWEGPGGHAGDGAVEHCEEIGRDERRWNQQLASLRRSIASMGRDEKSLLEGKESARPAGA
ncbi:MAG: hypothetical protein DMG80_16945 [Acidobacteria bacterium]|nr:MAG: hypothetical protein DMG80_16945 [Acidobacteriota bacterium]